ncbi:MAG: family 1 glycosylhydrolase, partial [Chthoniobacterales bacterium]
MTAPWGPRVTRAQAEKSAKLETGPFWWGVSTSGYQTEDKGYAPADPRYFKTDWDLYVEKGDAPVRGDATYSYTQFDRDLALLQQIGVNHYRFGVEWARIEPKPGVYNEEAIEHYVAMAKKVRAAGIEPIVCLWHFTFPDWLTDLKHPSRSHWLHPDADAHWQAYVTKMVRALKPYVRIYAPQNEPNGMLPLSYLAEHWPPAALLDTWDYKKAMKACIAQFREAAAIIKTERPDALVMSVQALPWWKRNYLWDPTAMVYNAVRRICYDHLDGVHDVCDIIGFNYYYSQNATIADFFYAGRGEKTSNYTQMGWIIDPESFYSLIMEVQRRYRKPMVIAENGIGTLNEQKKIKYLRDHINQMRLAMANGADVRGYFAWTLVDNYEWHEGYKANFGLAIMNPITKERTLEASGLFYHNLIQRYGDPRTTE